MAADHTCRPRCCAGSSGWRVARTVRLGDYQRIAACHRDSAGDGLGRGRHRGAAVGHVPGEVDHHDQWRWPHPFRTYAELLGRGGGLAAVAEAHRRSWTSVVAAVPDGAAALVVGHGGGIEPGLVACLPDADHESWGRRRANVTAPASALATAGSPASSSTRRRRSCCPGCQGGWVVEGARSFRWSFPHAVPGTTGRHQADGVSDLSSEDGTP